MSKVMCKAIDDFIYYVSLFVCLNVTLFANYEITLILFHNISHIARADTKHKEATGFSGLGSLSHIRIRPYRTH